MRSPARSRRWGEGVSHLALGAGVAVNPSLPCGACRFCLAGQPNHCLDMRFYGSAMRLPHVQGGFAETLVCEAARAVVLPDGMDTTLAAFAEPLSVCLHAAKQAGPLMGARVLVTGAGPIGTLAVAVARHAGAREIVVTDLLSDAAADRAADGRRPHRQPSPRTPTRCAATPWTRDISTWCSRRAAAPRR